MKKRAISGKKSKRSNALIQKTIPATPSNIIASKSDDGKSITGNINITSENEVIISSFNDLVYYGAVDIYNDYNNSILVRRQDVIMFWLWKMRSMHCC